MLSLFDGLWRRAMVEYGEGMLSGKVALVTGARRGIGKAIAVALARVGAHVAVNDIPSAEDEAQAAAEEIRGLGRKAIIAPADIVDVSQVEAMIECVVGDLGGLDILVNNAGIIRDAFLVRMTEDDWRRVIEVNLTGTFLCTRAAAKHLTRNGGCIVNVSSVVGITGNIGQANYSASKAGIIGLTRTCARELGSRRVRVNAIAPGFIESQMTEGLPEKVRERVLSQIPLGRMGAGEEVAAVAVFLASPAAAYVTGQVVCVDGGLVMA
jgi:3-oxoacyl-[acyl-carrier protein] reductase